MVPKGWNLVAANDICNSISVGIVIKPSQYYVSESEGVKAFRSVNVREGFINNNDWVYLSQEGHVANKKSQLLEGDVLIVRTGYPGTACVVTKEFEGANAIDIVIARPNKNKILPEYLCAYTNSEIGKAQVLNLQGGMAQKHLNVGAYQELQIKLPLIPEQRKITKILSTWDQAIKTTEKLLANSQLQKSALVQQMLMGRKRFIPFVNSEDYFQAKYGLLPSDWSFLPLSAIAKEVVERNSSGAKLPVLSCSKYRGFVDSLEYFKKQVFGEDTTNYKIIEYGSFGFPSNHIEEGSIGYQNICEKGMVSPIYTVFKTNEKIDDGYIYKILKTDHYRQIFAASTNASVDRRGSLRWKEFSTIRVPVPPLEEQKRISSIIDDADREVDNYQRQLFNLQTQKKALMQQLLTGKRRVKVDES